jgi:hypothetical protein
MRRWGLLSLVILLCVVALMMPGKSSAASGFSVITSPLPIDLVTKPGGSVSTQLRIKNTGPSTQKIKVGLMKFGASGSQGIPTIANRGSGDNYFDWVSFSPSVFDAPSNIWMSVTMTINTPKSAALGYYYAVTFSPASSITSGNGGQSHENIIGSTATMVLLEVQVPNERRSLHIDSFSANHKFYQFLPTEFKVNVHNDGNIYLAPRGDIFINRGSKTVATITVNGAGGNVLPTTNRVFSLSWTDGFPIYTDKLVEDKPVYNKNGEPKRNLQWNFSKASHLRFGHYTAKLLMVYNDGTSDVPLQATLSFWVVPWLPLTILLVVLLFVGVGLWSTSKGLWRKVHKISPLHNKKNKDTDGN